jgi:translation initiation factor IF-1
VAPEIE